MGSLRLKVLNGGLDTRDTPVVVNEKSMKSRMFSPNVRNSDMFYQGAVSKRRGKEKQGGTITGASAWATQATNDTTKTVTSTNPAGSTIALCGKVTAGSTAAIVSAQLSCSMNAGTSFTARVVIKADSAGSPGSTVTNGTSGDIALSSVQSFNTFVFSVPPTLTSGSDYWFCLERSSLGTGDTLTVGMKAGASSGRVKSTVNSYGAFTTEAVVDFYYSILSSSATSVVNGIYDYRFGSSSTQKQMASAGGALYWNNAGTWTSIASSLGSGQNNLWDFEAFRNYLFSSDYANNISRSWEGSSTGMMKTGYRLTQPYGVTSGSLTVSSISGSTLTMAANQYAGGIYVGKKIYLTGSATLSPQFATIKSYTTTGTVGQATYYVTVIVVNEDIYSDHTAVKFNGATVINNGGAGSINTTAPATCFSILHVTELKSGGFRCAEFSMDTEATNTSQIEFTNVAINSSTDGTQYGFDINSLATSWYMSEAFNPTVGLGAALYRKIPAANMSTSLNPFANSTTAFNITSVANLSTSTTLLDDYGLEQEYFTEQIDAPICSFMALSQGFLFMAGNPAFPSRLFYAEQNAPNIWSDFGQILGGHEDINSNDGQVITGIATHGDVLYVFKRRKVFMVEYTYNNVVPFQIREIESSYGSLGHFSAKSIGGLGLVFMSENGPSVVSGTVVRLLPGVERILDRFEPNSSTRYNLSAMVYTTCGHNTTKKQIWWGVSSTSATTRDMTLVYDYEIQAFWENDISANYYQEVTDSNFFPYVWSGDYSAQVFKMDTGTNDNGSAIPWQLQTPQLFLGGPFERNRIQGIFISGDVQSSGTLSVDIYRGQSSTITKTITWDMSRANFKSGYMRPLGMVLEGPISLVLRNSELDVPVRIDCIGFDLESVGSSYLQS